MKIPNRLRSYPLWVAIAALVGVILNDTSVVGPEKYNEYVDYVFAVLIALGVINNPSHGSGFKDSE